MTFSVVDQLFPHPPQSLIFNMSRGNSQSDELRDLVRCLVLKLCQKIRLYGNL